MEDYLATVGRIFNIQRFSVHDGPGIRTIIFLKGCALKCKWCCNPESQLHEIQQMKQGEAVKTVGEDVTAAYILEKILADRIYYRRSGGGVTLSGGEMLCQADFSAAVLRASKENGVNTAVESTGFAKFEVIEKVLPYINLYLMDIKHTNSDKHRLFTTRPNELILENAARIAKRVPRLIVRVPVIPTFNDSEEEIADIARFAKTLDNVDEMHLLPYHRYGTDKYAGLDRRYLMEHILPPSDGHMQRLADTVRRFGLKCQIGG